MARTALLKGKMTARSRSRKSLLVGARARMKSLARRKHSSRTGSLHNASDRMQSRNPTKLLKVMVISQKQRKITTIADKKMIRTVESCHFH